MTTPRRGIESLVSIASSRVDILAGLDVPEWYPEGLCSQTDPEAFFPEKGGSTREAKKICHGCPVRSKCLDYAIETGERFGIWGGVSERERRKLERARREAVNP